MNARGFVNLLFIWCIDDTRILSTIHMQFDLDITRCMIHLIACYYGVTFCLVYPSCVHSMPIGGDEYLIAAPFCLFLLYQMTGESNIFHITINIISCSLYFIQFHVLLVIKFNFFYRFYDFFLSRQRWCMIIFFRKNYCTKLFFLNISCKFAICLYFNPRPLMCYQSDLAPFALNISKFNFSTLRV